MSRRTRAAADRPFWSRQFPGGFKAVDAVTFTIKRGKTLGLVGESGSGKSTIGRCVAALQKPTTGLVNILGRNIAGLSQRRLRPVRARFGFVFQDPATSLIAAAGGGLRR